jgi:hypothetical protein
VGELTEEFDFRARSRAMRATPTPPEAEADIAVVAPDKPLMQDAPICDCGTPRWRDATTTLPEDDDTQLTIYVCATPGCPFEGVPYQIRERRPQTG